MEGGRSLKADQPSDACFLYPVNMQRVLVVPNAMIFQLY